jgi:hypothetical protein
MSHEEFPVAVSNAKFTIAGVEVEVVVLDDGRRIITQESLTKLFDAISDNSEITPEESERFAKFLLNGEVD